MVVAALAVAAAIPGGSEARPNPGGLGGPASGAGVAPGAGLGAGMVPGAGVGEAGPGQEARPVANPGGAG